jgi:phosphoglycerate dehydrogenase-like enzyme
MRTTTPRTLLLLLLGGGAALFGAAPVSAVDADPEAIALIERLDLSEADEPVRNYARWRKPRVIAINMRGDPAVLDQYRQVAGDAEIVPFSGFMPAPDLVSRADVIVGFCSTDLLEAAKELRWLHNFGVGVEECALAPDISDYDFILTNNQRISGPTIAEHVIAMMTSLAKGLQYYVRAAPDWSRTSGPGEPSRVMEIEGRTMLVVGLGGIGTEVARRAHGLGMHVIATRNSSREGPDFVEYVGLADELHILAGRADVIVNCLPLTEQTRGLFDQDFFAAVKRGAYFISIGRGESTVTDDLVAALDDGTLAGAGLDVTDPEPLPADHALWRYSNVIISPHVSGQSNEANVRRNILIKENLRRYVEGEKLLNVVDLKAGY